VVAEPLSQGRNTLKPSLERSRLIGSRFLRRRQNSQRLGVGCWQRGGGFDGVIAKRADLPYQAGSRDGMQKIKRYRNADCVIAGFRYAKNKQSGRRVIGSLLLGMYDKAGLLTMLLHFGKATEELQLTNDLAPLVTDTSFTGNTPVDPAVGLPADHRNGTPETETRH
jgi:ATP-dependent DNA ligase